MVDFVRQKVTYVRDPDDSEYITTATRMLQGYRETGVIFGDCDDHVVLLNSLLMSLGVPAKPVGVKFGGSTEFNHVISGVWMNQHYALIDPCAKNGSQAFYQETLTV